MTTTDIGKRGGKRPVRGAKVQHPDGEIVTPQVLNIEKMLRDLEWLDDEGRRAFLSVLAHSLTVDIRSMLIDRPRSTMNLDHIYRINEFLHQLTSFVNPWQRRSAVGDIELIRTLLESAETYGLQAAVGRGLTTARNNIMHGREAVSSPGLLHDVIALGGRALEAEDQQLRSRSQRKGRHGGLLSTEYERYYQFIVWKALSEKYDANIEFNYGGYLVDLVILQEGIPCIFEMKYWREESPTKIYSDIVRLQSFPRGGFLLIFSANPKKFTDENIKMIELLPGIGGSASCHRFQTENPKGDASYEFWFAGWPVASVIRGISADTD